MGRYPTKVSRSEGMRRPRTAEHERRCRDGNVRKKGGGNPKQQFPPCQKRQLSGKAPVRAHCKPCTLQALCNCVPHCATGARKVVCCLSSLRERDVRKQPNQHRRVCLTTARQPGHYQHHASSTRQRAFRRTQTTPRPTTPSTETLDAPSTTPAPPP